MGWENRKGKRYYYQKERQGNRVVSTYFGAGETARLIAELDQLRQERRQHERMEAQTAHNQFVELASAPKDLALVLEQARTEVARVLTEAGYHQHKRTWRKKRDTKEARGRPGADAGPADQK
jgi:hypothetical protein